MGFTMQYDPHEPGKRTEPFVKDSAEEDFFLALNQTLRTAVLPMVETAVDLALLPIIYVVGAPRSGTTLLSQMVCRYLPVGYINNLISRFWLRPSVGIRLSGAIFGADSRRNISFKSVHGTTQGLNDVHEFGYFWRHWLRLDDAPTHHLSDEMLALVDRPGLKQALEREILGSFQRAVEVKNVICGFHAAFLTQLHPLSLFVNITRDPYAAAASILKVRMERYGSYHVWWSLKPSTYPFDVPSGDAASEVAMQVIECRREIAGELARPGVRSLDITYEELCADPLHVLNSICELLNNMGYAIQPLSSAIPPMTLSGGTPLPAHLETRLWDCLQELS
jgi:hypothetical protein